MIPRRLVLQVATGAVACRLLDKVGAWRIAPDLPPRPDLQPTVLDEPHPAIDPVAFVDLLRKATAEHASIALYLFDGTVLEVAGAGPAGTAAAVGLDLALPSAMQAELERLLLQGGGAGAPRGVFS